MITNILETLKFSTNLIVSPDIDGFTTAKLLHSFNPDYKIVGTYDKNILLLADGYKTEDCLFVDCDMNRENLVSIGNHQRLSSADNMSSKSFNPNTHYGVTTYTKKYPFATAFLISAATRVPTSDTTKQYMLFADSTYKNLESYSENMNNWRPRMECDEVAKVFDPTLEDLRVLKYLETIYKTQGFVSKRFGKKRYISEMNYFLEDEGMNFEPMVHGIKYASDKVGKTTLVRYMDDIISYAEIFGGEYSVTYDQVLDW